MQILAIDPATRSGFAQGEPGRAPDICTVGFRKSKADGPEEIFGRAVACMATRLRDNRPDLMAIEQPFPSQRFDTSMITLGLYGIFTGIAHAKGVRILSAPISTWRKYALGSGRFTGPKAKAAAVRLCGQLGWDVPGDDHNGAESALIWLWACSIEAPKIVTRAEPLFVATAGAPR